MHHPSQCTSSGSLTGCDVFLAGPAPLACTFLGDESGLQAAVTLGHLSFLEREREHDPGLEGEGGWAAPQDSSLEKCFSFLPSSAAAFLPDASYFVLDESWKPHSLIEFSAISHDSMEAASESLLWRAA